jgi:ammonium transporter, Amt family
MFNHGDAAWLLMSAALVLLMTPGVAFFYSGLVSTRNVINTINMSFICLAVVPILWALIGFSLTFAPRNAFIGGFQWAWLRGLEFTSANAAAPVPEFAFAAFHMMFAVIAPALISGAIVGRMRFKAYVFFIFFWSLLIYTPIAHWVWGPKGWIGALGAIDFAGGTVVHINAGFAALVAAMILGPRLQQKQEDSDTPHNIPFVILGSSLLWFGWYGFNAGSALTANGLASLAFVNTSLSPASSIITWTILCWLRGHPSSAIGKACSAVIGLVAITPAAGFVNPPASLMIGCISAIICYFSMSYRYKILKKIDDTLDVFICHGVSGVMGAILTGFFATKSVNPTGADGFFYGNPQLVVKQLIAVVVTILVSMIGTAIILYILKFFIHIRAKPQEEREGIDIVEHGESAYTRTT